MMCPKTGAAYVPRTRILVHTYTYGCYKYVRYLIDLSKPRNRLIGVALKWTAWNPPGD